MPGYDRYELISAKSSAFHVPSTPISLWSRRHMKIPIIIPPHIMFVAQSELLDSQELYSSFFSFLLVQSLFRRLLSAYPRPQLPLSPAASLSVVCSTVSVPDYRPLGSPCPGLDLAFVFACVPSESEPAVWLVYILDGPTPKPLLIPKKHNE
jgi:hypothetical protein